MIQRYIAAGGVLVLAMLVSFFVTIFVGILVAVVLVLLIFRNSFVRAPKKELDTIVT